jgi:ketosteroid isomerase-like protein
MLLALPALALASAACGPAAQEVGPLSEEDVAALEGAIQEYVQSALAGDLDTWAGLWAEDAVKMDPNSPALEGREAIRASMAALSMTEFTASVAEVDGRGDLAYVRGAFSARGTVEGMPEPLVVEQGKYLTIFKKQPDGTWLIAIDIWNSDLPLPEPGAES